MTRVSLDVITMIGAEYALFAADGGATFPHGELGEGESPAEAARRVVDAWTGTKDPKLELVDMVPRAGELVLVFRAQLTSEPSKPVASRHKRMELPAAVGRLEGKWVEDALKTSLNYKLTRQ